MLETTTRARARFLHTCQGILLRGAERAYSCPIGDTKPAFQHDRAFRLTLPAVMRTVLRGDDRDSSCDLDQILRRLTYRTTKQSLQFSIRALIRHGMIEEKEPSLSGAGADR